MFRYICLTLITVLSTGNAIRLESLNQTGFNFWFSVTVLLFSTAAIVVTLPSDLKQLQKRGKMKIHRFKKQDNMLS